MYEKGYFEEIHGDGKRTSCYVSNVMTDEMDGVISVNADNQFLLLIPKDLVKEEDHPEDKDVYVLIDGTTISFYYDE